MSDQPEKVDLASPDLASEARAKLEALFPGVITDGVLDATRLGEWLGIDVAAPADGRERYGLVWAGKAEAVRSLQTPSRGTLIPDLERSVDWDAAQNVFIEGDNLEVLKLLQKAYNDRVKLIYIDPPYNTGNDFVYNDDFQDGLRGYLAFAGRRDQAGNLITTGDRVEQRLGGLHSRWLNMMYPRLKLAWTLLSPDGAIAISIDDHEVHALRALLDDIFGPENFVAQLIWKSKSGGANDSRFFAVDHEYVLVYARNADLLQLELDPEAEVSTAYPYQDEHGKYGLDRLDKQNLRYSAALDYTLVGPDGTEYRPAHKDPAHPNATWRWSKSSVAERMSELVFKDGFVYTKNYKKEGAIPRSLLVDERFGRTRTGKTELEKLVEGAPFDNPKPPQLIRSLVQVLTQPGDLVLDFFAGSGTTADAIYRLAAEGQGRRWLLIQLPEVPAAGSPAASRGYKTIAEVTIARIAAAAEQSGAVKARRILALADSNFAHPDNGQDGQLVLQESTLVSEAPDWIALAAEALLKEGVALDVPWERKTAGGADVIVAGRVAVVLTTDITDEVAAAALALRPKVLVFLEDGFAGRDAVKTNAFTNAKQANIKMKTV